MSPSTKVTKRAELAPEYVAELRRRVDALGFRAVARASRMGLGTLWRVLTPGAEPPTTVDATNRVLEALAMLDPEATAMPPPVVSVLGEGHHRWSAFGAELARADGELLAQAMGAPASAVRAELRRAVLALAKARKPRRKAT